MITDSMVAQHTHWRSQGQWHNGRHLREDTQVKQHEDDQARRYGTSIVLGVYLIQVMLLISFIVILLRYP
jgi:hypothetical protein